MFQLLVQFLLKAGILLCSLYFSSNIKAHANENASKTTTLTKNLPV